MIEGTKYAGFATWFYDNYFLADVNDELLPEFVANCVKEYLSLRDMTTEEINEFVRLNMTTSK